MGAVARIRPKRLAEKLLQIRLALGFSQTEMLRRLGFEGVLTYHRISNYEKGTGEQPLPMLLQYARLAGVSTDVLIDDDLNLPTKLPGTPKHRRK